MRVSLIFPILRHGAYTTLHCHQEAAWYLRDSCLAHQNNCSAKYASGTGEFRTCSNTTLRDVLNKAHLIIARVHRTWQRLHVVHDVQKKANRKSIVIPVPSVVTCWDSSNLEVTSLNRIMGDFNKALDLLLDTTDSHLLEEKDRIARLCVYSQ